MSGRAIVIGLLPDPLMVLGSRLGKRIVDRLSPRAFLTVIDAVLLVFGLFLLLRGSLRRFRARLPRAAKPARMSATMEATETKLDPDGPSTRATQNQP